MPKKHIVVVLSLDEWQVETLDEGEPSSERCFAVFSGLNAMERADEYAAWMNAKAEGAGQ